MPLLSPPFMPSFGVGVPGANVPKNQPYFDTSTNPYAPYIYNPSTGLWKSYGVNGGVNNAVQIQGVDVDPTPPTNGQTLVYSAASTKWVPQTVSSNTPAIIQRAATVNNIGPVVMGAAPTAGNLLIAILSEPSGNDNLNGAGWTALLVDNLSFGYGFKIAGVGESATQTPSTDTGGGSVCIWEIQGGTPGPWYRNETSSGTVKNVAFNAFAGSQLCIGYALNNTNVNQPTLSGSAQHGLNFTGTASNTTMFDFTSTVAGANTATLTYAASCQGKVLMVPIG